MQIRYPWVGTIPRGRAWQPTPVFMPGESHGQRSLAGYIHRVVKSQTRRRRLSTQASSRNVGSEWPELHGGFAAAYGERSGARAAHGCRGGPWVPPSSVWLCFQLSPESQMLQHLLTQQHSEGGEPPSRGPHP